MSANFRRGADAAEQAAKSGGFSKTHYFGIEDGDEIILRFLTDAHLDPDYPHVDAWYTVQQHQMIPTKGKPAGYEGKWPKTMGAVCRKDEAFDFGECYICDEMVDGESIRRPGARMWALACVREVVRGDGSEALGGEEMKGKIVGVRDKTREVTLPAKEAKDGEPAQEEKVIKEKEVVVVNMGWRNFFSPLQGFANQYGTILDRDYWIKRSGAGTETTYQIVPRDPIMDAEGNVFDARRKEVYDLYEPSMPSLPEVITGLASDEFYARFFDPRYTADDSGKVSENGAPVSEQAKPSGDVDPDKLAAIADRVKGSNESKPAAAAGAMRNLD